MLTDKRVCTECDWHGLASEELLATSPFEPDVTVTACPKCKAIDKTRYTCDEPGCWDEISCGTPVKHGDPKGYRNTCSKHQPPSSLGS